MGQFAGVQNQRPHRELRQQCARVRGKGGTNPPSGGRGTRGSALKPRAKLAESFVGAKGPRGVEHDSAVSPLRLNQLDERVELLASQPVGSIVSLYPAH